MERPAVWVCLLWPVGVYEQTACLHSNNLRTNRLNASRNENLLSVTFVFYQNPNFSSREMHASAYCYNTSHHVVGIETLTACQVDLYCLFALLIHILYWEGLCFVCFFFLINSAPSFSTDFYSFVHLCSIQPWRQWLIWCTSRHILLILKPKKHRSYFLKIFMFRFCSGSMHLLGFFAKPVYNMSFPIRVIYSHSQSYMMIDWLIMIDMIWFY